MLKNIEKYIPVEYKSTWIDKCITPMDAPAFQDSDPEVKKLSDALWCIALRELFLPTED